MGIAPAGQPVTTDMRGTSAAARGGTTSGMPMGSGHRRDGEEERTHSSFLEEPDPESVFGTDQYTAPPVIGGQP
jgi:hypothetical protein